MTKKTEFDIYRSQIINALHGKLTHTLVAFENQVRRWYSKTFYTKLTDTFKIPWPYLLEQYYEQQLSEINYNTAYDLATQEHLEKFKQQYDKENEEFAQSLLKEQEESIKNNKELTEKQQEAEQIIKQEYLKEYNINFNEDMGDIDGDF